MTDHAPVIMLDGATLTVIATLLVPAVAASAFIIRYFWKRAKCLDMLKQRVDSWEIEAERDRQTHRHLYERINHIDRTLSRILGHLEGPDKSP